MLFRLFPIVLLLPVAGCSRERTSVTVDAALLTQAPNDTVALGGDAGEGADGQAMARSSLAYIARAM